MEFNKKQTLLSSSAVRG